VHHTTVSTVRSELAKLASSPEPAKRIGADGKRRCVEIALKEFPDWGGRRVAEACGVSHFLVQTVQSEKVAFNATPAPATRTVKDDKRRCVKIALTDASARVQLGESPSSPEPPKRIGADGKRRCVEIALKEFPDWSDRRIAEACGVSDRFVNKIGPELRTIRSSSEPPKRIGADGKARSMPTPRESRGWTAPEVAQ